jgi:hypothetical protein
MSLLTWCWDHLFAFNTASILCIYSYKLWTALAEFLYHSSWRATASSPRDVGVRFQFSDVQVLRSWHHRLRIWTLISVTRRLAIAALPWMFGIVKLTSRGNSVFKMNIQFCCPVTCAAVFLWPFFETVLPNVRRSLSVQADFHPLFVFGDLVFPWSVYADITLETVALDSPNSLAVFVTDAPAKCAPTICPFSKSHLDAGQGESVTGTLRSLRARQCARADVWLQPSHKRLLICNQRLQGSSFLKQKLPDPFPSRLTLFDLFPWR